MAAVLLCLLPACHGARGRDTEAIQSLVRREVEAINAKDLAALSGIWSQDKSILLFDVPPPGRFRGWSAIGRLFKDFFDRFSEIHLTVDRVQIEARGDLAFATYDWTLSGRMGDYAIDDRGRVTSIYRREKEGWRLVHENYSAVPPGLAGQPGDAGEDTGDRK
jgi:ketosteroid isomerase-like protein